MNGLNEDTDCWLEAAWMAYSFYKARNANIKTPVSNPMSWETYEG